jgi:hypothetical protein
MKIELDLDLNAHLARHIGYDEEGEPLQHPTTIEDVVLGLAADKIARTVTADQAKAYLLDRVTRLRDEVIREELRPLVVDALERSVQPTDPYGNPKGEATTLAEVITRIAKEEMTAPRDQGYGRQKRTLVQQIIAEHVDAKFKTELGKELDAGKAEVRSALREQGAALIQQAIEKAATR